MKSFIPPKALRRRLIAGAGAAAGLLSLASVAFAQAGDGETSASHATAANTGGVPGVVVQAPPKISSIPAAKRAALDAEAAKRDAWRKYRGARPAPTSASAPSAGVSASARAEDYPGLRALQH